MEEIVAAAPNGYRWFQLYVYRDRKLSEQIVHRVEALGYKALVLTVDVPYTGKRRNDIRNQFKLPPHLKVKNFDGVFQVFHSKQPWRSFVVFCETDVHESRAVTQTYQPGLFPWYERTNVSRMPGG